jgi:hypothetical protein
MVFQLNLKSCLVLDDSLTWEMITSWHAAELMAEGSDQSQLSANVIHERPLILGARC